MVELKLKPCNRSVAPPCRFRILTDLYFLPIRAALEQLRELVAAGNDYLKRKSGGGGGEHNRALLEDSAAYITRIFDVFGLIARPEEVGFPARGAQSEANVSVS